MVRNQVRGGRVAQGRGDATWVWDAAICDNAVSVRERACGVKWGFEGAWEEVTRGRGEVDTHTSKGGMPLVFS